MPVWELTKRRLTYRDPLQRNMVALAAEAKQKRGQYWNDVAFISADSTTQMSQHMVVWHDGSPPQGAGARPIDMIHFDGYATGILSHERMYRKMQELRNQFQAWLNANPGAEVVDLVRFLSRSEAASCSCVRFQPRRIRFPFTCKNRY